MKCETLEVWKLACVLSSKVYIGMKECRDYGFKDQITRSGLSIASNIAEGVERESDKESRRFLDIAQASSAELKTQIYIGMKIGYVAQETGLKWIKECDRIHMMIRSLKRSFRA
ncbi:MAG TPA: four helix bundle protein [Nitratifractor salsuginis]|uniref:Four helix bundle protein n=1 Tax=Nitratifractor salsuginis TaxID=269261 RepID=A0A7V2SIK8_9BACT|nr:four helix bundle protein [Nitratifractor salsuginis]